LPRFVRQHHERLDGSGYPLGLKADAILPEAKVVAVADMVEAMASNRPYRVAIKLKVVLEQIEKEAGSLLDAEAVQACVKPVPPEAPGIAKSESALILPLWSSSTAFPEIQISNKLSNCIVPER